MIDMKNPRKLFLSDDFICDCFYERQSGDKNEQNYTALKHTQDRFRTMTVGMNTLMSKFANKDVGMYM
ncbi:hypothetical protein CSA56_04425 [candidate division KSB3 bacterium]|uniref:Uncharacterized protein n=1 Tax=candidate division KSB3 bacterium TaxID=2044937 RepID=A0A2G6KI99_9BACT|nr:MAG: hypothetical protein CSA56_04425 [candidate division KSB3 bacterium]